ncbi:MAG: F0F1 ATP synthase subunit alpha [Actinobacteria bacterium]|nr:F0F1 ATP synthase subunit alpha [Actinomycetota bacterium]
MADLKINPAEVQAALANFVKSYDPGVAARDEVGTVSQAGDGIARVEGLPSTMANELLQFENGTLGLALNLDVREIGVVILGGYEGIEEGTSVRRTGEILSVPVGDGFLGRVVDPLGRPIDGKGEIKADARRALELQAPSVVQRQPVKEPLATGIKAIDAMTAIGRGQRQLIIGDRQTGKTAVAVDTIINQKENWKSGDKKKQVKCIYVAIGQKGSTIAAVKGALEEAGAMEYTTIVASPASDPAGFKYLAPYTGSAIGQHWMYNGEHVLGDVFYLHSRLLERCAKLSDELGGGSMTGLPIIETKGNDVSAFIPTNVISITDGQCFLETDLFNAGVRPAINVGISVSRVGGSAQTKAMKKIAGRLRLDLAQFRELEAFAAFGSDLDAASKAQLERGARMVELLKQGQYSPYSLENQIVSIWAGTSGALDSVPVVDIRRFESELLDFIGRERKEIFTVIAQTKQLEDDTVAKMQSAVDDFKKIFKTTASQAVNEAAAEALEGEGVEQITKHVPPAVKK